MMKKKPRRYNVLTIIIAGIIVVLVGLAIFFMISFQGIMKSKEEGFDEAKQFLMTTTELVTVDEMRLFQEKDSYYTGVGTDESKEEMIFFVPVSNEDESLELIPKNEIITETAIKNTWRETCSDCQFKQLNYAKINEQVLWELTYIDQENRYVMDYYDLYDGSRYERLRLKTTY